MKVTLFIHGLGGGGAERVISIVANYWVCQGWDVTLIMLVAPTKPLFYTLDPRIELRPMGLAGDSANAIVAITKTWQRIARLRQEIIASKPDVVISFMNAVNVYAIVACAGLKVPTIVCEHIYPGSNDATKLWQLLMKWTYRYADLVTVLTQNALPFYPAAQGYRAIVMPNPVTIPAPIDAIESLLSASSAIAIGRLHPQKGFDLLLEAFARLQAKYPDWQLTILGEGPMQAELEELRSQLKLTDRVHFPGLVTNVREYLAQADLFVMPSRFEGFPMALCEAMACGLPVLAADCLSGPRDIIVDGVDGVLVAPEDVDALTAQLDALMSDPSRRKQLALNAPQILDRFGVERVMGLWQNAIDSVIDRKRTHS
ncbi:glycosyltransferase family 4 protein [Chamaesiphon sp. VAR_48_metabat_403]|uniref:glycosyltransferase family 4 protein n=1 Tax=Chamaesiphon sp. VAR_48_metabat_403 TaxID=2964700 RepID=UPI00286E4082|nr:glycosyltransferase family 4 protein [Chamaesiphon sp. VAR_48_metabat_403]